MRAIVQGPGRSSGTSRFSSTVRLENIRRPSGTYPTPSGNAVGRPVRRRAPENAHCALARRCQSDEASERGRLTGPVSTEERDDLALTQFEAHAVQNVALAIIGVEAFRHECHLAHAADFP